MVTFNKSLIEDDISPLTKAPSRLATSVWHRQLNQFFETFRTDEISEEGILAEVKAVRRELHAK